MSSTAPAPASSSARNAGRTTGRPASGAAAGASARRRHSRRRYMVRRVVAFAVVVLAGFGLVRGAGWLLGGDGGLADGGDADGDVATGVTDPAVADSAPDAAGSSGPVSTEPLVTEPEATGPPSAANPATVLIVGDSDAGTFGPYLQQLLDGTGIVDTELDYKVSSGLARPDFFDWPAHIDQILPAADPDIVVATFGGNDANILRDSAGNDLFGYPEQDPDGWTEEYQARAGEVMDRLLEGGRTVVWVGIPNDDNPEVTARLAYQDQAAKAAAAERPGVIFVDTWKRFSGRDGNWAEFVIDPRDGVGKDVRADDGFHLNTTGAEILAIDIAQAIRDVLRSQGATI